MSTKSERENDGPSWTEVILGAVLSFVLGVALSALVLVLKPAAVVKELPKEPDANVVYYVEGGRNSAKARQAVEKQKTFLQGGSVSLNEDELNALAVPPAPSAKAGAKPAEAAATQAIDAGLPNFHLHDAQLQISVPVRINVAGLEQRVIVQARGGFVKKGGQFAFAPDELYVGSCPLHRIPVARNYVMKRFLSAVAISEELTAAWRKLDEVTVSDSALHLTVE